MYPNGLLKSAIFSKYETGCLDTPADMLYEFHNVDKKLSTPCSN